MGNARRLGAAAGAVALVVALGGCGGSDDAPASVTSVEIRNFRFVPELSVVELGQELTVTNRDSTPHTVTAPGGAFDSGELAQGQSFTFAVDTAGRYPFLCDLHQYMTGSLEVS